MVIKEISEEQIEEIISGICAFLIFLLSFIIGIIFWINTLSWVWAIIASITTFGTLLFITLLLLEEEE